MTTVLTISKSTYIHTFTIIVNLDMIRSFFLIKFQLSREQVHFQILTLVAFHNIF